MPTLGKMELTVKINEFPADIRTLENGWKQFDIDTGDRIITITVKPKRFKKLEQAQENYPQWVGAMPQGGLPLQARWTYGGEDRSRFRTE